MSLKSDSAKGCTSCANSKPTSTPIMIGKSLVAASSLYLLYIGVTCPCAPELYSCHLMEVYIAVAVIIAVFIYFNGLRVMSYNKHQRK